MAIKLYVVHGSHPCAAVAKALELKGIEHDVVELPPPLHVPVQRAKFGARTVPAITIDGEKLSGSRAIMRRLEELSPEPTLYPDDAHVRDRERADEWGDQVWQPLARRLLWSAFAFAPQAMASYQEGSKLPAIPAPVLRALAPGVVLLERRLNKADEGAVRADLRALPHHLDRIDSWIGEGIIGGDPTAADLQIASSTRLMHTIGDVRPLIAGRPAEAHALGVWPDWDGDVPGGSYPRAWREGVPVTTG